MKDLARSIIVMLLRAEARLVLRRFHPFVIGITGSVGKTSTKEAIALALGSGQNIRKSPRSYNHHIGLPLTILGLENAWNSAWGWIANVWLGLVRALSRAPYPETLVLEMGIGRPGDLDTTLGLVRPDIAVVTAIGEVPVHVEFFAGPDAVASEKAKIVSALHYDGIAVLNADDARVLGMRALTTARIMTYGFSPKAGVRASGYRVLGKHGISFSISYGEQVGVLKLEGVIGKQSVYALLAAAAVGIAAGIPFDALLERLQHYSVERGRLRPIQGLRGSLILDDTYNSSPIAAHAALDALGSLRAKRKIAVLGDMLELGKFTADEHKHIGEIARKVADVVVAVGVRSRSMEGVDEWFSDSVEAGEFVRGMLQEGDVVLVKGSQGMRMERTVERLMQTPENAPQLLVRQDAEWKQKV